jgi:hypothetical protein
MGLNQLIMTLSIRLPLSLENQLTMACQRLNLSKSQVVQNALKTWLADATVIQHQVPSPQPHPLLAFAELASAPSARSKEDYVPYSKEALRKKILAGKTSV